MSKVIIQTKGGPLTDDDFEGDAPAPGSSDRRYSAKARAEMDSIVQQFSDNPEEKTNGTA